MKKYTWFFAAVLIAANSLNAQVDRSKMPEPGPAPKVEIDKPEDFSLDNGIKVLVVENNMLPRVSYSLRIDNNPILEGDKAGVSSLLGAMLGNGTTSISKDKFNEEVDFLGANISFGSQSAFASGLSKYSDRILQLIADAAINPLLTQEEFDKEKAKLIEGLKTQEKDVSAIANRVEGALSYGVEHPYGEFVTEETVSKVTLDDVKNYYNKYFNPNNAYLVVVGDIDDDKVKDLAKKYFGSWKKATTVDIPLVKAKNNVSKTEINFIDVPNAVQSEVILTNNVDLKMNDEDYFPVLLANTILGGDFSSYLNMNLREQHGYTYGARSSISPNRYGSARFSASSAVRNMVTDSAVVETIKEVNRIRNEKVSQEDLDRAKAAYVGNFVMALERPQTIANYALNIELNDLDDDFYKDYLKNINAVTVEDVNRVANKYFKPENARIIVVGKGSDVLENLEKAGYPVSYYDKYAKKADKPAAKKALPEGVTVNQIMKDYVKAIGGEENLKKVKTIYATADVSIANVPMKLSANIKSMAPNKSSMEMSAEGMGVLMKQKFDGEKGYAEQQGQRKDLTEVEIAAKRSEKGLFPELYLTNEEASVEGVENVGGKSAYKVKVVKGDKDSYRYYDMESGLLVKEETPIEAQGQTLMSTVEYSDYKEVSGVMMPMTQNVQSGPQMIELKINNVVVNADVTDADFQ